MGIYKTLAAKVTRRVWSTGRFGRQLDVSSQMIVTPEDDSSSVMTWTLRHAALRRLHEFGVLGPQAEALLGMEPALGDRWPA